MKRFLSVFTSLTLAACMLPNLPQMPVHAETN